ncbi:hypothetical protein Pint_34349 [Pistacia integerrima]|uniref:Uncharacterized protein n=1 Tax=Pistacia integerrima TaxID=434235 RepID=A0ACC0X7D8_9ROSI|nr:hypothetical protein Pint_34349 [Pistacia integerrima]
MDLFPPALALILLFTTSQGVSAATFTFVNRCDYTIWPGILANAGSPRLDSTGFELLKDASRSFLAPTGWSGRFWARTGCNFDGSGAGSCSTGDCGSGQVECNGLGAAPPATLAEFTLGTGGQDFYDVSLVDGYNLPMLVETSGGVGSVRFDGLLHGLEPAMSGGIEGRGAFNTPASCKPSVYSEMFKSACPKSYSYAYDDATSTFTCSGADYTVTFCPSSSPSQKSSSYATPTTGSSSQQQQQQGSGSGIEYSGNGYGSGYTPGSGAGTGSGYLGSGAGTGSGGSSVLADGTYLAGLAMGDSPRTASMSALQFTVVAFTALSLMCSCFFSL